MGGGESEVSPSTKNILLEAASWDYTNIRRSVQAQQLQSSQAGYRFSRGVHPEVAPHANRRAADLMRQMGGGKISQDLVDEYPRPLSPVVVEMPLSEIKRNLGITIPPNEVVHILTSLDFQVTKKESVLQVTVPNHRMDIGLSLIHI